MCRRKTPEPNNHAPLESICTSELMELVCIDFWTAEQPDKKCVDVLVIADHFSKLSHAFPCKNQSAKQPSATDAGHRDCVASPEHATDTQ